MAIKILMTLEGSDQVKKALEDAGKAVDQFVNNTKQISADASGGKPLVEFTDNLKKVQPELQGTTNQTHELTGALHILRPILEETGGAIGGLGEFSAAARLGLTGLAAAVTGAGLLKIQNLGDAATKTKNQLGDLLGSSASGAKAFEQLTTTADQLGVSVDKLAPAFQKFVQAQTQATGAKFIAAPGAEGLGINVEKAIPPLTDLFTLLRANHATTDEATKTLTDFGNAVAQQGKVTPQALAPLQQFPALFDKIKTALGGAGQSNQKFLDSFKSLDEINRIAKETGNTAPDAIDRITRALGIRAEPTLNSFENALKRIKLQLPDTFDPAAPQNFTEAVSQLLEKFNTLVVKPLTPAGGGGGLTAFVTQATADLQAFVATTKEEWNGLQALLSKGLEIAPPIVKSVVGDPLQNIKDEFNAIMGLAPKVKDLFGPGGILPSVDEIKSLFAPVGDEIQATFKERFSAIEADAGQGAQAIAQALGQPLDLSAWQSSFQTQYDQAASGAQNAWSQINSILSQPINLDIQKSAGSFSPPFGFATGGLVSGPGNSTSDSILAYLSNREFVMNARAVSHYGAGFMHAVNSMMLPKFAEGGNVSTAPGTPVNLFISGERFAVTADDATAKSLGRFAVKAQLTSSGRKPSWVR